MSTRKPVPAGERRSRQAIELFEKATKALGKRDFAKARDHLQALIASFSEERDVVERARAYLSLCERSLDKRPSFKPKAFEDVLHHGVYLHNRGEYEDAMKFLRQATEMQPKSDHALYCLAATAARAGDAGSAVAALRQAVAVSPANRAQARSDTDFDSIRDNEEFVAVVYAAAV